LALAQQRLANLGISQPTPEQIKVALAPEFRQGYTDGCASVNAARKRDEARFKSAANYAMGFGRGDLLRYAHWHLRTHVTHAKVR